MCSSDLCIVKTRYFCVLFGFMTQKDTKPNKNIILVVGSLYQNGLKAIKEYSKKNKLNWQIAYLFDNKDYKNPEEFLNQVDFVITTDMSSNIKIANTLKPYKKNLLVITCTNEVRIQQLKKIIPHVPYLRTPTESSLEWSTDKLLMRKRLFNYDRTISPKYTLVKNATKKSIKKIEERVGYPLVVKPTGLAASVLISICYHEEELQKVLKSTFRKIKQVYKERGRETEPQVLVEEFMEGDTYSVDCYVNSRGKIYYCPFVHVKTGQSIGFDDFFGYRQMTPTLLEKEDIGSAQEVAKKAIYSLGLRSTTAHVELMRTTTGWKVIEVGPRIGGFRDSLYRFSYGIEHTVNDILNRIPQKLIIPTKIQGYSAALKFFALKEGNLEKIVGIKKVEELESLKTSKVLKKIGNRCTYAKNGGTAVLALVLFNKDRSKLLADIRRAEQTIKIETTNGNKKTKKVTPKKK